MRPIGHGCGYYNICCMCGIVASSQEVENEATACAHLITNLIIHKNNVSDCRPLWLLVAMSLVYLDGARVWLSRQTII